MSWGFFYSKELNLNFALTHISRNFKHKESKYCFIITKGHGCLHRILLRLNNCCKNSLPDNGKIIPTGNGYAWNWNQFLTCPYQQKNLERNSNTKFCKGTFELIPFSVRECLSQNYYRVVLIRTWTLDNLTIWLIINCSVIG